MAEVPEPMPDPGVTDVEAIAGASVIRWDGHPVVIDQINGIIRSLRTVFRTR